MTTTYEEFDFEGSYGAEVAKESGKGGDFAREVEYLRLDASPAGINQGKDQTFIRLLTEYEKKPEFQGLAPTPWTLPWITVKQHYAQTKQRPPYAKEGSNWPGKFYAVCRKDKVFAKKYGNACYLCDALANKTSDRSWALAVEREQIIDPNTKQVIGMRDKTREVSVFGPDGKPVVERMDGDKKVYAKKTVPAYLILNFGYKNFFNALSGQASYFQTILDADYVVKRTGMENNDTNYTFVRLNPITITGEWAQSLGVADGTPYHLGLIVGNDNGRPVTLMERIYPDMPDLRRIVAEKTFDDYYGRWFIPGWLPEGFDPTQQNGGGQGPVQNGVQQGYQPQQGYQQPQGGYQQPATPQPTQQQGTAQGPTQGALAALRERVTQQPQGQQPQGQQQAQQGQPDQGQPQVNPWNGQQEPQAGVPAGQQQQ